MYSKRFWLLLLLPVAIVVIGAIGMMALEHLSFLNAIYFTIVTIGTVGFGDIHPVTTGGKILVIFLIIIGIGTFLTILTGIAQRILYRRERNVHRQRLNMLIGVFFTEAGNELLHIFTHFDPNIHSVRKDFAAAAQWSEKDFAVLRKRLKSYEHAVDHTKFDPDLLHQHLKNKGEFLIRQLENSDLTENETFTELLWSVVHLRDELAARSTLASLPEPDMVHLANDVKWAYSILTRQWLEYMLYLKRRYPFLFSLAVRTNPFALHRSAVVKE
jgi:voltage-gated potassium channel